MIYMSAHCISTNAHGVSAEVDLFFKRHIVRGRKPNSVTLAPGVRIGEEALKRTNFCNYDIIISRYMK